MHRVWETLTVLRLVHWWSGPTTTHSTNTTDTTDSSNRALLDATSLRAHHVHSSVVGTCRIQTYRGVTLVWTAMVDPLVCLMLRVVTAWCHWDCMLCGYVEMVIISAGPGRSSTIDSILGCSATYDNILRIWHYIAAHIILPTLVGWGWVAGMIWMICWCTRDDTCGWVCTCNWSRVILICLREIIMMLITAWTVSCIGGIILFSWLRTDSSKSTESWTTFAWIVVMVISVTNWASTLVNDLIRA